MRLPTCLQKNVHSIHTDTYLYTHRYKKKKSLAVGHRNTCLQSGIRETETGE